MPKYEVIYHEVKDNGMQGDSKQVTVDSIGQDTNWLRLGVSEATGIPARNVNVFASREVK